MSERGFSLVEILVAVTMSLVVFGLVGTSLVAYQRNSQRTTNQNDSQDGARVAIDRMERDLRNVASSRTAPTLIEGAGAYDVVFQTIGSTAPAGGSQNPAGLSRTRYCVPPDPAPGAASKQVLVRQVESWTSATAPANPWPISGSTSTACPFTPGSLPAGVSIATSIATSGLMNRRAGANRPAFSYDSATLSLITTVGIDLVVDADTGDGAGETSVRSAAFIRNQNQQPVASFTATPTGAGHVLLNGGSSSDPDNQSITYQWFKVSGTTSTAIGTTGLLDWAPSTGPGGSPYTIKLLVTDAGGLTSTSTQSVVVS